MDDPRFDRLTRLFGNAIPRRPLIAALAAPLLAALATPQPASACKHVGRKCDKNKDCCDGANCPNKRCRCKDGLNTCGNDCVNFDNNENHRGGCNLAGLAPTDTCCDGTCVLLDLDETNRGSCGNACATGETCCFGACFDLQTDPANCRACGRACTGDFNHCVAGQCVSCPADADHCVTPSASCEGWTDCFCLKHLADGGATCANRPRCDEACTVDADCPGFADFCASAGEACCPSSAGQGRCAELCAA